MPTEYITNGNFENVSAQPTDGGQVNLATGWSSTEGTADLNSDTAWEWGDVWFDGAPDTLDSSGGGNYYGTTFSTTETLTNTLSSTIPAGEEVTLSFDYLSWQTGADVPAGANTMQIVVSDGSTLTTVASINLGSTNSDWTTQEVTFTAPAGGISSISFAGQTQHVATHLDNVTTNVCFTRDTMIDTDQGEVAVQDLEVGMMVRTRDNGMQPVRWVGMSPAKDRAVRIKAGAMGNTRDLVVSPRHRMVLDGWQLDMLFDHDQALVTAMELINDDTIVRDEMADVEYYHVMFDQHEVIYAEGAATESFHPDQASMGSMDAAARAEILALFPDLRDGSERAEIAPTLDVIHTRYVGDNLDAFVN